MKTARKAHRARALDHIILSSSVLAVPFLMEHSMLFVIGVGPILGEGTCYVPSRKVWLENS